MKTNMQMGTIKEEKTNRERKFEEITLSPHEQMIFYGTKHNIFIFLIKGEIEIKYKSITYTLLEKQFVFLPENSFYTLTSSFSSILITHTFYKIVSINDISDLMNLNIKIKDIKEYQFKCYEIKPVLFSFLQTVHTNLPDILQNKSFQEIKELELFFLLRQYYTEKELLMLLYPLFNHAQDFRNLILHHYTQVQTAKELARLLGYSLSTLNRHFHKVFGDSAYQWMQKQKAEKIKQLLIVQKVSLHYIQKEYGFTSAAHLNKFCKKHFGQTPAKLKMNKGN